MPFWHTVVEKKKSRFEQLPKSEKKISSTKKKEKPEMKEELKLKRPLSLCEMEVFGDWQYFMFDESERL